MFQTFALMVTVVVTASATAPSCISLKAVQELQRYRPYMEKAAGFLSNCTGSYAYKSPVTTLKQYFNAVEFNIRKLNRLHYKSQWLSEKGPDGHCYMYSKDSASWKNAVSRCKDLGGYLVKIDSSSENRWVSQRVPVNTYYWIGVTASEVKYKWKHSYDNASVTYSKFYSGYPRSNNNNCVVMYQRNYGYWYNFSCYSGYYFICETNSC